MATSWSDIVTNHAMVVIDDERLNELSQSNPAVFFRRMSLYVKNAIPLFNRPPEIITYLKTGLVEPQFDDFTYDPDDTILSEDTTIETPMTGYDICCCESATTDEEGNVVYETVTNFTYDPETGVIVLNAGNHGEFYSFDFYKDGSFGNDLTDWQKRILGLCVASVWDERFFRNWLNDTPKIKDQSFATVNEATYMREGEAKKVKNRAQLNDELRDYEQKCAYRSVFPFRTTTLL